MASKLDPIDFGGLAKDGNYNETTNLSWNKCTHKNAKAVNGMVRCPCGAAWSGPGLNKLLELLTRG